MDENKIKEIAVNENSDDLNKLAKAIENYNAAYDRRTDVIKKLVKFLIIAFALVLGISLLFIILRALGLDLLGWQSAFTRAINNLGRQIGYGLTQG